MVYWVHLCIRRAITDDEKTEWTGPPSGAKWFGPLNDHLRDGFRAYMRDFSGLTARVKGGAGLIAASKGDLGRF